MTAALAQTLHAPTLGIARLFDRLPAAARAELLWTRKPIQDALSSVIAAPSDVDTLDSASRSAMSLVQTVMARVLALQGSVVNLTTSRATVMSDLAADCEELASFVDDACSVDTLDWCVAFIKDFYREVWVHVEHTLKDPVMLDAVLNMDDEANVKEPFQRGIFALMAALECTRRTDEAGTARTLIDVAFLELETLRERLARVGLVLIPYADDTLEERQGRLLRCAGQAKDAMTPVDVRDLEDARLLSLGE